PDLALAAGGALAASAAAALGARRLAAAAALATGAAAAAIAAAPPVAAWTLAVQGAWLAGAEERPSSSSWILIARPGGEPAVLADRAPVAAGPDRAGAEEAAHLALSLHPAPRRVAVVGVPPPGTFAEIARHGASVEAIVEDAGLLAALREALPEWAAPSLVARSGDARRLLAAAAGRYDAVLVLGPAPATAAQNRAFTLEALAAARRALAEGGLLAVALPGHAAAASLETRRLHASLARTLEAAAGPPLVLPAGRTLYLAGRRDLPAPRDAAAAVSAALAARGIAPLHLGPEALRVLLSPQRTADAARWASLPEPPNRDLRPTTYRLALARTLAQAGDLGAGALALLAAALAAGTLLALGPRSRPVELAVAASGASGLSLQLVLLLAYQIGTGALYRELGLLSAGFMAGAAAGAWAGARRAPSRWVLAAAAGQAALALVLAVAAPLVARGGPAALPVAVAAGALAGLLPGAQFAAAARLLPPGAAGTLWAADLAGAAVAAAATFTFAVPALGVRGALLAVAALQCASAALLLAPSRARPEGRRAPLLPALPLALAAAVVLAAWGATQLAFSSLATGRGWRLAMLAALVSALAAAAEPGSLARASGAVREGLARVRRLAGMAATRVASLAALLPAAAFPVARCFFQVPFLFCHACPRPCAFGWVRPYAVPAALVLNVFDRRFCQRHCPLGTAQSACGRLAGRPPRRLRRAAALRWPVLAFTAIGYFAVERGRAEGVQGTGLYALLFRNDYAPSAWVLGAAALLLLASFRWRRPFCDALCPIGAASALVRAGEARLVPLRAPPRRGAAPEAGRG
ncbi:MAG TPA: 4Fe-4S binding protein, partial [Anaeromyxobacter sp.]|nr:4Fe-4S binding protein [Anaeromyxobacter sp.]